MNKNGRIFTNTDARKTLRTIMNLRISRITAKYIDNFSGTDRECFSDIMRRAARDHLAVAYAFIGTAKTIDGRTLVWADETAKIAGERALKAGMAAVFPGLVIGETAFDQIMDALNSRIERGDFGSPLINDTAAVNEAMDEAFDAAIAVIDGHAR